MNDLDHQQHRRELIREFGSARGLDDFSTGKPENIAELKGSLEFHEVSLLDPAGLAAAVLAGELGLDTILIDEQDSPRGQIYRGVEHARFDSPLGPDYLAGWADLANAGKRGRLPAGDGPLVH